MPESSKPVNFARLVDWMEGRLPADEAKTVEEAVARADDTLAADIAWLRKFRAATGNALVESPPRKVSDALTNVFEARARAPRPRGFVKRVLAGPMFDSNLQPAAGLRAASHQQARRQLVYHAGTLDLAVNLLARGSDNDLDMDCQVLPLQDADPMLYSVQLLDDGRELALTAVDEMGSFALERVPPGSYELVLSADRTEISIEPFDVDI